MTIINIELEDNLSAVQISRIKDLLKLIRGVASVSGEKSHQLTTISNPEPLGNIGLPAEPKQSLNMDQMSSHHKKHIISQAIAWGSKHGQITLDDLDGLTPQELLNLSMKFLNDMTDSEKDRIFSGIG